jgi:hypothetical protein
MKKTKHIIVRITESQFKKLADVLIIEKKTKSSLMRDLLSTYMDENKIGLDKKNQNKT